MKKDSKEFIENIKFIEWLLENYSVKSNVLDDNFRDITVKGHYIKLGTYTSCGHNWKTSAEIYEEYRLMKKKKTNVGHGKGITLTEVSESKTKMKLRIEDQDETKESKSITSADVKKLLKHVDNTVTCHCGTKHMGGFMCPNCF